MVKTITVNITIEDCDVAEIKKQLTNWYVKNKIGISYFNIN